MAGCSDRGSVCAPEGVGMSIGYRSGRENVDVLNAANAKGPFQAPLIKICRMRVGNKARREPLISKNYQKRIPAGLLGVGPSLTGAGGRCLWEADGADAAGAGSTAFTATNGAGAGGR
ncbi:hypothetical protein D3C71_1678360 [compost metagenome]